MENDINRPDVERPIAVWTAHLANGDEQAWIWFHEQYYWALLRFAAHCFGNPSAASEIVQQAYLRVARHSKPFDHEPDFWGWLCCVVRCAAMDHVRQVKRRLTVMEKFAHWRASHSEDNAAWHPSHCHAPALAEEALTKLPTDDARLLLLKYRDGWSTRDLASSLGTTPKAIEHRLARLRERMRKIILSIQ